MKNKLRAIFACLLLYLSLPATDTKALQILGYRDIKLTLIPNYVDGTIGFDGQIDLYDPARSLEVADLPLAIEHQWHASGSTLWNLTGTILGGKLTFRSRDNKYHLTFGPIQLQPDDKLRLVIPFVNLNYKEIQPLADDPDRNDIISRQFTHLFTYTAGDSGRELSTPDIPLDIPFTPVVMKVDLILVPLIGKGFIGQGDGLRLYGRARFEAIQDFDEFSRYCQIGPERLKNGDYRVGHLLYNLDFPSYFGLDVLNPVYEKKPTSISLRSELNTCQYDKEKGVGTVEAAFSGRVFSTSNVEAAESFPQELRGSDVPDGNYAFSPPRELVSKGVQGYQIILGQVYLAPGDVLTLTVPNALIQADFLQPPPSAYETTKGLQIVYVGPQSFELSLPYIPQTNLYASEFPSILRPAISLVEDQLGEFSVCTGSATIWIVLALGLVLYLISKYVIKVKWLSIASWLVIAIGFLFGVRGSFGLLCVAVLIYMTQASILGYARSDRSDELRRLIKGIAGFVLIFLGVYMDAKGTDLFSGLADAELSPLTPVVLIVITAALFLLMYRAQANAKPFMRSDLPVLILLLVVLSLYDAFDKSLLALAILFIAGVYITRRALQNNKEGARRNDNTFGIDLRRRVKLVLGNRIVPIAILVLMIFAIVNDLISIYANEMQALLPPLAAPLVIPLLVVVSVFLTFTSIALLFVLLYPFLPFQTGYMKAVAFALVLFLVFLFGIGTDERLIMSLPNILVGRIIYYLSVPMLIGVYLDINDFMQKENKRHSAEGEESKGINFQTASSLYFKDLRGLIGTLAGIVSLVAPTVYAFLSSQPVMVTYFSLLEKLLLLPT